MAMKSIGDAEVVIRGGPRDGDVYPIFEGDEVIVGSSGEANLQLVDVRLAPRQFSISDKEGRFYLGPIAQTPTIFLNGVQVSGRCVLENNYRIEVGGVELRFVKEEGSATSLSSELAERRQQANLDHDVTGPVARAPAGAAPPGKPAPAAKASPEDPPRKRVQSKTKIIRFKPITGSFGDIEPSAAPDAPETASAAARAESGAGPMPPPPPPPPKSAPSKPGARPVPVKPTGEPIAEPKADRGSTEWREPVLRVTRGPVAGQLIALDKAKVYVIGRGHDADIVIPDHALSRKHCRVTWQGETVVVEDLGSANRTYVNGAMIDRVILKPRDTMRLGESEVEIGDGRASFAADAWSAAQTGEGRATRTRDVIKKIRHLLRELDPLLGDLETVLRDTDDAKDKGSGTDTEP